MDSQEKLLKEINTPLMKQYVQFKEQYPDALLLMRVGDFYETYGPDAVSMSRATGMLLTRKTNGSSPSVDLCGFPYGSLETYLPTLVKSGFKVAVCDQLEDPKMTKTLVKRGVTELVTPGVVYNEDLLDRKKNNYLVALAIANEQVGIAFVDVSTGEFKVAQGDWEYISLLAGEMQPNEVLVQKEQIALVKEHLGEKIYTTTIGSWAFVHEACCDKLSSHFGEKALKGFDIESLILAKTAAGAALFYLEQNCLSQIKQITSISRLDINDYVWLDNFTVRNLEIFNPIAHDGVSLLTIMDKTVSPMGARLLRTWLSFPLKDTGQIERRYNGVEYVLHNADVRRQLRTCLGEVGDMERLIVKAATGRIVPRGALQLKRGLDQVAPIAKALECMPAFTVGLEDFSELSSMIAKTLDENPAAAIGKGDTIASGVNMKLDNLRNILRDGKQYLADLQQREAERTGIPSLKVKYNGVFGYFLEVRNAYRKNVPPDWIRKQTLVNAERYVTQELKQYEEKIITAEDDIIAIEQRMYAELVAEIQKHVEAIQLCCKTLAEIDCIAAFAELASRQGYCRPKVNDSLVLDIKQGRHPVLETQMPVGQEYVANDLYLDTESQQIIILTGPNMAGKSALLRQTAMIVLMAQCGCFVPAREATIGIVDKIFTRVGASDNISQGESTFMVEMLETSKILHGLTRRSLVLLDEIGRGTSTFDGMSIAWAIVEYLHDTPAKAATPIRAKAIFATHYHELNMLEKRCPRVKNYHIEVKESGRKIIFLRKLSPGGVAHSFGLHVARMAGMPPEVLMIAEDKLAQLERDSQPTTLF